MCQQFFETQRHRGHKEGHIWIIVSNLADEKINPNTNYKAEDVRKHFEKYKPDPQADWIESVDDVLNQIFPQKKEFDMDEMLVKAEEFSEGNDKMLDYIKDVLNDSDFQNDPEKYLSDWVRRRGFTEEIRWPEDKARRFFRSNFS